MNQKKIKKNEIEDRLLSINWTPLHTRLISHRIGDGTVNFYGHAVYDNKHIKHFSELADKLNVKLWIIMKGDSYGTKKVIIHKKSFKKFSKVLNVNSEDIIKDPVKLLEVILQLPEEHKLQTIFSLIVDDGSCKDWMITIFEDQNEEIFDKVKYLWDSLFPDTSTTYIYTTKEGTKVYHLKTNREGIIQLQQKIYKAVEKYGSLANLWWKQKDLDLRYSKAVSKRAKQLNHTKKYSAKNKQRILNYLRKNKFITVREVMKLLNLSLDRTHLVLNKLVDENKIFVTKAGGKSRYSIEHEDISIGNRSKIITEYLKNHKKIYNRDVRKLLNLGEERSYAILKELTHRGILKQINKNRGTYYVLTGSK